MFVLLLLMLLMLLFLRRGKGLGVDFFHCMQCNACMSLSLFNSHTCR
jgi:hypothetical protein